MKKRTMSSSCFVISNLMLLILFGLLAGCPRKHQERGVTTPANPPAVVLNMSRGSALHAKVTGLTVVVTDQASGAVVDTQTFADPTFPLNLTLEVTIPPCLYAITATAVLRDGSRNSASASVDACAFAGDAITLAIVTEEPTPTPSPIPTVTPTSAPTVTPTTIPMLIPTTTPTPTETPVPPTPTPTETPVPPLPTPTETPTTTPTVPPTPPPTCIATGPISVGGYSWYFGTAGQSCTTICGTYGLVFDNATETYAGQAGSLANCDAVLTALYAPGTGTVTDVSYADALGCGYNLDTFIRFRNIFNAATADGAAAAACRACACSAVPTCGGMMYNGYCWYLSFQAASCDDTCTGHGAAYDAAGTETYLGYPGAPNAANCDAVLGSLLGTTGSSGAGTGSNGCCRWMPGGNWILDDTSSSSSTGSGIERACACTF